MKKVAIFNQNQGFESEKFDVVYCQSSQAVNLLSHDAPDVAVIDVFMDGIDGLRLIEQFPNVKFIVATNLKSNVFEFYARKLGCLAYLEKPLSIQIIEELVF
ncbi:MAG: response regulator [Clostridia bacterium]|nr:response regulator [Clostridia bacterium]